MRTQTQFCVLESDQRPFGKSLALNVRSQKMLILVLSAAAGQLHTKFLCNSHRIGIYSLSLIYYPQGEYYNLQCLYIYVININKSVQY